MRSDFSLVEQLSNRLALGLALPPVSGGAEGDAPPPAPAPQQQQQQAQPAPQQYQPPPVPQPQVQAPPQQQAPPPPPAAPQVVSVPYGDFQTLMAMPARLAQFEAAQAAAKQAAEKQVADALLSKGQAEEAVKTVREQWQASDGSLKAEKAALEDRARNYAIDTAVAQALAGVNLMPGAAAQIQQLIRGQFEAAPEGSGFTVRTKTFETPADVIKNYLAVNTYFLAPRTTGGGGPAGGSVPAPSGGPGSGNEVVAPSNPGQEAYARFLGQSKAQQDSGYGGIGFGGNRLPPGVFPPIPQPTGTPFGPRSSNN